MRPHVWPMLPESLPKSAVRELRSVQPDRHALQRYDPVVTLATPLKFDSDRPTLRETAFACMCVYRREQAESQLKAYLASRCESARMRDRHAEVFVGIHRSVVNADFVVKMGTG